MLCPNLSTETLVSSLIFILQVFTLLTESITKNLFFFKLRFWWKLHIFKVEHGFLKTLIKTDANKTCFYDSSSLSIVIFLQNPFVKYIINNIVFLFLYLYQSKKTPKTFSYL